ncbi:MAG TPA: glycosyltransferase family 2 protein [Flavobacteriales bacterium]|nr:glycosyltransferase family 2 protein [Flavobacteriales bacterium]HRQ83627.1 glycosyltransferase family 2 protein [Flavobacteriales bacterium]
MLAAQIHHSPNNACPQQCISVIIPVYNEARGLGLLLQRLESALAGIDHEVVLVNDGSKDDSFQVLNELVTGKPHLKVIDFRRNFGQTAAINAGIQHATNDVLVLMDSDLENDPADIPKLVAELDKGYDVVSGWRRDRWKGQFLTRKLPSLLANKLISSISGVKLHDYGCTLKAYRREVIKDVVLYGQMHRFIPVYCSWQGGRVGELAVNYSPRQFGKSNYGLFRTYKVLLDLLLIKFLDRYMTKPIHFFGGAGFLSFFIGGLAAMLAIYFKLSGQKDFVETPLPTLSAMFFTVGVLLILMGVLAEVLMRVYFESQAKTPYTIRRTVNVQHA